jgi:hypothetical protein
MNSSTRLRLAGTPLAACAVAQLAPAQPALPQAPFAPAPADDLQQLPETRVTVQRFTLTPRGELDGFLPVRG